MRILLTGANGLIGSAVYKRLVRDHEVLTLGRGGSADLLADLSVPEEIAALVLPSVDALVHCAGVVDEDFIQAPARALQTAVLGADALVQAARSAGARRLVYISSAHVYGPMIGKVDERNTLNPVSNYAIAHFATEQVFRRQASGTVAAAALRPCAVFGELANAASFRRWSLIPFSFPRDAVRDHHIVIRSTGEQQRNFVGTTDIAECCATWLSQSGSGWEALNPLGVTNSSVFEFAQLCASVSEKVTGNPCQISRVEPTGPTTGSDFQYDSISPITLGAQSLPVTVEHLMRAIQET